MTKKTLTVTFGPETSTVLNEYATAHRTTGEQFVQMMIAEYMNLKEEPLTEDKVTGEGTEPKVVARVRGKGHE